MTISILKLDTPGNECYSIAYKMHGATDFTVSDFVDLPYVLAKLEELTKLIPHLKAIQI